MNTSWTKFGLGVCALSALAGTASAQKASGAERGLIGVNLYDTGLKVVSLYGSPDEVQPVTFGGTSSGSGGGSGFGGAGGPGFGGAGGGPRGAAGGGGGGGGSSADRFSPFDFGDDVLRQRRPAGSGGGGSAPRGGPPGGFGPGGPSGGPPPGYGGSGFGGPPTGGGGGAASTQTEATQYTRWVYNRLGSKYGFIVDNQGRVVQIEAIGMQNNRVKTRKGLGFGATFAQIIKTYGNPDGYEVGGDTILVKYLVNKKVAFRLTRLEAKKPHVVTGIVVAAGKI